MSAQEVERVMKVVYELTGNEKERREGMAWLQSFSTTQEAWNVTLQLLGSSSKQVQFYAGNILYTKVQKEWQSQADHVQADVHRRILEAVRGFVGQESFALGQDGLQRVCLILARITVQTPQALDTFVSLVWTVLRLGLGDQASQGLRERGLFVSTELLKVLPEEREACASPTHSLVAGMDPEGIDQRMLAVMPKVMEAITELIKQPIPKFQARALDCLTRWAPLGVDLAALARYSLMHPILCALTSVEDLEVVEAASAALVASVNCNTLEKRTGQPESPAYLQACDQVVEGLLATRPRLQQQVGNDGSEELTLSLCRATIAVAEHQLGRIVAGEHPHLLPLIDMVMAFTGHPSRGIAIHTLNFWLLVQDFPLQERHESLREPCFVKLLEVLLQQCHLGETASSGSNEDVGYEIESFRTSGDGVKEPFVVSYYVLGPKFLECMLTVLRNASDWQAFEAALFALSAVSKEVVQQVSANGAPNPQTASTKSLIETILSELPGYQLLGANGATLKAGVALIGEYARILARMNRALIEKELEYILFALPFSHHVSLSAAAAFRNIAIACRLELAMHTEGCKSLAAGIEKAIASFPTSPAEASSQGAGSKPMPLQARLSVVEGLTRVTSCMKVEQCTETLGVLLTPGMQRLHAAVEAAAGITIVHELEILRTAIQFVDAKPAQSEQHPVAGIMQGLMPILERISMSRNLQHDADVVQALYALISTSFISAHSVLSQHLESLLKAAVNQFRVTWTPCCITCVGKAIEIFVKADTIGGFNQLFKEISEGMIIAIRDNHASENQAIIKEYFDTARNYLIFCPSGIFQPPTTDILIEIIAHAITGEEAGSLRATCAFLQALIIKTANPKFAAKGGFRAVLEQALQAKGGNLVQQLLIALADRTPASLVAKVTLAFAEVAVFCRSLMQEWTYAALVAAPQHFTGLTDQNKQGFVQLVPLLNSTKAGEVFDEFSKACRKKVTNDSFQSYMENVGALCREVAAPPPVIDLS
ncbi:Importin-13 (Imp13) [Durusdinium trenchii]|uniref:Importin-13 (Imp13) n=1 Tax=Durusdinium trenchii TaxID=1381693 RepID=A0ABP0HH52_9DINO